MSQENVEIVRRAYEAYNRADLKTFGDLLAPDAIADPLPDWPESQRRHGREEVLRLLVDIRGPLERNEATAEKFVEGGDYVVTAHVWGGVMKGTDSGLEGRVGMAARIRAGRITELRWFRTFAEALEAAGLEE
jgi:ketosteroid isomerase-like protein